MKKTTFSLVPPNLTKHKNNDPPIKHKNNDPPINHHDISDDHIRSLPTRRHHRVLDPYIKPPEIIPPPVFIEIEPEESKNYHNLKTFLFIFFLLMGILILSFSSVFFIKGEASTNLNTPIMLPTPIAEDTMDSFINVDPFTNNDEGSSAQIFHHKRVANSTELKNAIIEAVNKYKKQTEHIQSKKGNFEYSIKRIEYSLLDIEITLNSWLQDRKQNDYDPMFDVLFYNCCCYMDTTLFICSGNGMGNIKRTSNLKCYIIYNDGEWKWIINFDDDDNIGYLLYESRCVLTITSNKRME